MIGIVIGFVTFAATGSILTSVAAVFAAAVVTDLLTNLI